MTYLIIAWAIGALATTIWATRMPDDDELDVLDGLMVTLIAFVACTVLWPVFAVRKLIALFNKRES